MSAIALGTKVAAADLTDLTAHSTGSFVPTGTGGDVLLLVNHHTHGTAATPMNAPTGACLTNAQHVASLPISATRSQDIWLATTTGSTDQITFHYNETATGAIWTVQEFLNTDINRGVNNAISGLVANLAQNSGIGTTFSVAMPYHVQHPANAFVSIWGFDTTGHNITPESGWTEIDDQSTTTPTAIGQSVDWRIGEDLTPTATVGVSVTWVGYGLELWGEDASGNWSSLETFTKGNSAQWGDDQPWSSAPVGSPTVVSNQASASNATIDNYNILANDSSTTNHEVRVSAATMALSGNSIIGIRVRAHSSNANAYEFLRVGATTLSTFSIVLRKRIGGALTYLGGTPIVKPRASLTTPEQMYMTVVGSTITCYLDGVQVIAATDTALTSRNRGGLLVNPATVNGDTLADNFAFGDIGKTNSPKAFASTGATTASKAKASITKKWTSFAKSGAADQAFATLSSRIARLTARVPTVSSASATRFATQVEGFSVTRKLIPKIPTASSAKASLTSAQKQMATKVPTASASGLTFHPVFLDVKKGQQGATVPTVSSAKATLIRTVGETTKVFQTDGVIGHFTGGITGLAATVPIVSSAIAHSVIDFEAKVGTASSARATEWTFPPGVGGFFICPVNDSENPTTCAHKEVGDRLFRHYRPRPVGRNVYLWSDGTVSESDPDGYSHIWREADRTGDTLVSAAHVLRVFWGGHDGEQVSNAEATLLTAAGYTVRGYHA